MESPPPVPPKDTPATQKRKPPSMEHDREHNREHDRLVAPHSGSKRKRPVSHDDNIYHNNTIRLELADREVLDIDGSPLKSTRSSNARTQSDASSAEDNNNNNNGGGGTQRLRRQKKVNNLSSLSLRQAAERQRDGSHSPSKSLMRGSKFQEGSLTDKPSEQPPSVFTKMTRTDSGNLLQVDDLMEEYAQGNEEDVPVESVERAVEDERAMMGSRVDEIAAAASPTVTTPREEKSGFFRFGKSMASNFHPVALWNKLWNETKEELTRQNMLEAERKQRLKEEAEAKYAQMKANGQFHFTPVGNTAGLSLDSEMATPRDSGVVMPPSQEHSRHPSTNTVLMGSNEDTTMGSATDAPGSSGAKPPAIGTLKSRFHFKKPSISDLKSGLKRVRSDFNLAGTSSNANTAPINNAVHNPRPSSSSLSPTKHDFSAEAAPSTLKKSASKYDLKKQNRLSKRVSDLETKLRVAREELNEALVEASPMPKLGGRYERFTPNHGTVKGSGGSSLGRPKFVPGRLPRLDSERVLMDPAEGMDEESPVREGLGGEGVDTFKSARERNYPRRVESLFNLGNRNIEEVGVSEEKAKNDNTAAPATGYEDTKDQRAGSGRNQDDEEHNDTTSNMEPSTTNNAHDQEPTKRSISGGHAKPEVANATVKPIPKGPTKPKSKKRKSEDAAFKPGKDGEDADDDNEEWERATPKKKRKSGDANVRVKKQQQGSPPSQKGKSSGSPVSAGKKSGMGGKKAGGRKGQATPAAVSERELELQEERYSSDEADADAGAHAEAGDFAQTTTRGSIDSQASSAILEPVYEAEEEEAVAMTTAVVPLKGEPRRPTAVATPARYEVKSGGTVQVGDVLDEEGSPGVPRGLEGGLKGLEEVGKKEGGKVVKGKASKGSFEWPEDVF